MKKTERDLEKNVKSIEDYQQRLKNRHQDSELLVKNFKQILDGPDSDLLDLANSKIEQMTSDVDKLQQKATGEIFGSLVVKSEMSSDERKFEIQKTIDAFMRGSTEHRVVSCPKLNVQMEERQGKSIMNQVAIK